MATVTVRALGKATTTKHRKVTIKFGTEVLTLPIASPEVSHDKLAPEFQEISRPGQRPLLRRSAEQLRTMSFEATFHKGGKSVESGLALLRRFAAGKSPLAVAYGPMDSGMWQLTDLQVRSMQRELGTNAITQATASLTFTEHFADGYQLPTAVKPKTSPAAPAPKGAAKTYVVKSGDTLSKIAAKQYGDANRWPAIAQANKLRDPNRITAGQKLVLP